MYSKIKKAFVFALSTFFVFSLALLDFNHFFAIHLDKLNIAFPLFLFFISSLVSFYDYHARGWPS